MWRQRGAILVALAVVAAASAYATFGVSAQGPLQMGIGSSTPSGNDCADAAMAAIADKSPNAAQNAYECMAPSFQQRVPEQAFVQQVQAQAITNVQNVARVGDYPTAAGGTMVYYAVNASGQTVGYIVYLGQDGKVLKIQ